MQISAACGMWAECAFFDDLQHIFEAGFPYKKLAATKIFRKFVLPFLVIRNLPISTVFYKSGTGGFQTNLTISQYTNDTCPWQIRLAQNKESFILKYKIWTISVIFILDRLLSNLVIAHSWYCKISSDIFNVIWSFQSEAPLLPLNSASTQIQKTAEGKQTHTLLKDQCGFAFCDGGA